MRVGCFRGVSEVGGEQGRTYEGDRRVGGEGGCVSLSFSICFILERFDVERSGVGFGVFAELYQSWGAI